LQELIPEQSTVTYRVGEPFTRTIEIQAEGLTAAQLPPLLEQAHIQGFKMYPDKPELEQKVEQEGLVGVRREKVAMVPMQAGRITLPEIRVRWWNVRTGQVQSSIIAAREIEVLPARAQAKPSVPQVSPENSAKVPAQAIHEKTERPVPPQSRVWPWLTVLFAVLWLLTLGICWRKAKVMRMALPPEDKARPKHSDMAQADNMLKQACRQHDARLVLQALPIWVAAACGDEQIRYLAQVKEISSALKQAVFRIEQSLYAPQAGEDWDCEALWQALEAWREQIKRQSKASGLKPLYPDA